jgi:hypothetical protein
VAPETCQKYRFHGPGGDFWPNWHFWQPAHTNKRLGLGRQPGWLRARIIPRASDSFASRHKGELGHAPELAYLLAYGEALNEWHRASGTRPLEGACAGCEEALSGHEAYGLHNGARLHGDACLARYGERSRTAGADALVRLGIVQPTGWQP